MRILFSSLAVAGLLSSHLAAAQCARPVDHTALDVAGLKTQLMVTALTCSADEKYNAFIMKYRPDLVAQDKSLNSFFSRAYGRSAVKQRDDYVTQLANSLSQNGLKQGSRFCDHNLGVFDEVMALRNNAELSDFAAGRSVAQPISLSACGATPERATTTRASARPARRS